MGMTKHEIVLIADTIKECMDVTIANPLPVRTKADTVAQVAYSLASALANDNPRFDRERFLKSCGIVE